MNEPAPKAPPGSPKAPPGFANDYEGFPDGPGHLPDPRLGRAAGLLLVGLFLLFVLLTLLGL